MIEFDESLKESLQREFAVHNSTLIDVASGDIPKLREAGCVLIGTSQPGYRYGKAWVESRLKRSEEVPFVHFTVGTLHNGLAPHYGRVVALLAAAAVLPRARTLVYTDIDTAMNFHHATLYPPGSYIVDRRHRSGLAPGW